MGAPASMQRRRLRRRCLALLAPRGGCDGFASALNAALHKSFSPKLRSSQPRDAAGPRQAQSLRGQALSPDSVPAALRALALASARALARHRTVRRDCSVSGLAASALHRRLRPHPPRPCCHHQCFSSKDKPRCWQGRGWASGGAPLGWRGAQQPEGCAAQRRRVQLFEHRAQRGRVLRSPSGCEHRKGVAAQRRPHQRSADARPPAPLPAPTSAVNPAAPYPR